MATVAKSPDKKRKDMKQRLEDLRGVWTSTRASLIVLWGTARTRVVQDAQTARAVVSAGTRQGARVLKQLAIIVLAAAAVLLAVLCTLCVCLLCASVSAFALQYYYVSRLPESRVVPLSFNTMPLHTEWWRNRPVDEAVARFLPAAPFSGRSFGEQRPDGYADAGVDLGESPDDLLGRIQRAGVPALGSGESAESRQIVQAHSGKLLDFKLAFYQQYMDSVLATSTMYIPTGHASTLFLPGGTVNMESVFDLGSPMFRAQARYSGRVQLVFLRENVGRDVSVVVESAMLFAEDAGTPQALDRLDVLFQQSRAAIVRTGESPLPWIVRLPLQALRLCFYVPVKAFEVAQRFIRDGRAAPFPPIDHDREVSLIVDIYDGFTPPLALQTRLRAMNFTVFYDHQQGRGAPSTPPMYSRPKLARMSFYSHVELQGLAYYFVTYPGTSFRILTLLIFIVYSIGAAAVIIASAVVIYLRCFQGAHHGEDGSSGDEEVKWSFDGGASFSSSGVPPASASRSLHPRRGADRTLVRSASAVPYLRRGGRLERSPLELSLNTAPNRSPSSSLVLSPADPNPATQVKKVS